MIRNAQVLDFIRGEGRCPVVPLVFKTSLGVVRSPEGSTPSLLRHKSFIKLGGYNLYFGSVAHQ
jgi:hypothetical protein